MSDPIRIALLCVIAMVPIAVAFVFAIVVETKKKGLRKVGLLARFTAILLWILAMAIFVSFGIASQDHYFAISGHHQQLGLYWGFGGTFTVGSAMLVAIYAADGKTML